MSGSEDAMQVPTLPESLILDYLAEGAANVVYRLSFPESLDQDGAGSSTAASSTGPGDGAEEDLYKGSIIDSRRSGASTTARGNRPRFQNRVLRLRKSVSAGVPIAISARSHREVFQPLFPPGSLLDQDLVRMPSTIISSCNVRLREDERSGERPDKRHGVYLAEDEAYGILLTDMTPGIERDGLRDACEQDAGSALDTGDSQRTRRRRLRRREVLVEFKPKWLVQSPSAPAGATRCRTCALRAQRNATRRRMGQQPERSFCPLGLVSADMARVDRAVRGIFDQNRRQQRQRQRRRRDVSKLPDALPDESLQELVVRFLHRHPLLLRLKQLQVGLDKRGPAQVDLMPSSFSSSSSSLSSQSGLATASSRGVVGAATGTEMNALERDFLMAMTLRDCTVFLKIPIAEHDEAGEGGEEQEETHPNDDDDDDDDDDGPCITNENDMDLRLAESNNTNDVQEKDQSKGNEATKKAQDTITMRLGDLDLKSPSGGKWSYWRGTEQTLIDEGWYFHSHDSE